MNSPKRSERIRLKRLLSGIEGTLSSEDPSDQLWALERQRPWVAK